MSITAYGNFILDKGWDVSGAITQYHFVKADGVGGVTQVTATTDNPLGVSQFHVTVSELARGKGASVRVEGISEVYCTGAVSAGDLVGLVADGSVRTAQSGDTIVGQAYGAGADGERAPIALSLPGHVHP
jgi:hypothetical protein